MDSPRRPERQSGTGADLYCRPDLAIGGAVISGLLTFPNAAPGARVTALAGGRFLVTSGGSAQAFDGNGQAITGVIQIQSGSVAAAGDGGFVVLAQVGLQLVPQQYAVPR